MKIIPQDKALYGDSFSIILWHVGIGKWFFKLLCNEWTVTAKGIILLLDGGEWYNWIFMKEDIGENK